MATEIERQLSHQVAVLATGLAAVRVIESHVDRISRGDQWCSSCATYAALLAQHVPRQEAITSACLRIQRAYAAVNEAYALTDELLP